MLHNQRRNRASDTYRYFAFGKTLTSSGATTNNFRFVGNLTVTNDNGTVTTNTWTYENRLRTVALSGGAVTKSLQHGEAS